MLEVFRDWVTRLAVKSARVFGTGVDIEAEMQVTGASANLSGSLQADQGDGKSKVAAKRTKVPASQLAATAKAVPASQPAAATAGPPAKSKTSPPSETASPGEVVSEASGTATTTVVDPPTEPQEASTDPQTEPQT